MRAKSVRIGDLAVRDVVTVTPQTTLTECAQIMRNQHVGSVVVVRRLPVLDEAGKLTGLIAIDNVLEALAEQVDSVVGVLKAEQTKETVTRR
ncbi:MAG: CBS domain-containing protein [Burkholderiaceae bacterium]|nr:CBS domain-containing protein [Burkholderiaceae bacterium]